MNNVTCFGATAEPLPLKDICRRVVRQQIGKNHLHRIQHEMNLPTALKNYLLYQDYRQIKRLQGSGKCIIILSQHPNQPLVHFSNHNFSIKSFTSQSSVSTPFHNMKEEILLSEGSILLLSLVASFFTMEKNHHFSSRHELSGTKNSFFIKQELPFITKNMILMFSIRINQSMKMNNKH